MEGGVSLHICTHTQAPIRLPVCSENILSSAKTSCVSHACTTGTLTSAAACRTVVRHDVKTRRAKGRLVQPLICLGLSSPVWVWLCCMWFFFRFGFLCVLQEPSAFKETRSSGRLDQDAHRSVRSNYRRFSQTLLCCKSPLFCRGNDLILSSFNHQLPEKQPVSGFLSSFEYVLFFSPNNGVRFRIQGNCQRLQKSGSRQTARSTGSARSVTLAGGSQGASFIFTYVQRKEREEVNRFLTSVAWRQTGVSDSGCTKKKKKKQEGEANLLVFPPRLLCEPHRFLVGGEKKTETKKCGE